MLKTDKFSIIDQLERKYIMMPNGNWHLVTSGKVTVNEQIYPLNLYHIARLEGFLRRSKTEAEYQQLKEQ